MPILEEVRTVTADGRVVVPWVIQRALGLEHGGPVRFHVENGVVTCPWHAWRFRLNDGTWADNPRIKIGSYPVRVEGDEVQVSPSEGKP